MLNKPWRNETDLKNKDEPWQQASVRLNMVEEEEMNESQHSENEALNENRSEYFEIFNERDWMAIAAVMPDAVPKNISLGNRDIDLLNDCTVAYHQYPDIKNNLSFMEKNS